jgi:hypothetical protein
MVTRNKRGETFREAIRGLDGEGPESKLDGVVLKIRAAAAAMYTLAEDSGLEEGYARRLALLGYANLLCEDVLDRAVDVLGTAMDLLDAWSDAYDGQRRRQARVVVAARSFFASGMQAGADKVRETLRLLDEEEAGEDPGSVALCAALLAVGDAQGALHMFLDALDARMRET